MSFSGYEQVFIVKDQLVSGISNCDMNYNTQTEPLYIAGMGYVDNFISGPTEGQVELSRYMLGSDFIKSIQDEEYVRGGIILDSGRSIGFKRSRLLNYGVSCNVGQVPEIRNTFKVYGNLGGGVSPISSWNSRKAYDTGDLVSVAGVDADGFADDKNYRAKQAIASRSSGFNEEPSSDTENWESVNMYQVKKDLAKDMDSRNYIIPTQGSIKIDFLGSINQNVNNTLSEFPGSNPILSFNYSRGIDLDSLYALREEAKAGQKLTDYEALDIQIIYPIKTTFDFTVSMDNYKLSDMRAFLDYSNWRNGRIEQDISVKMNDPQSQDLVMEYKVNKAKLLSEAVVSKTMDETVLNISFEGYEVDDLSPFFSQYVNIDNANDVIYRDQWLSLSSADQANYKEVYADSATPISSLAESRHAAVNINRR
jgi:hypothetical protein